MIRPSKPINIVSRKLARQVAADILDLDPARTDDEGITVEDILRHADINDLKIFVALRALHDQAEGEGVLSDLDDTMSEWYYDLLRRIFERVNSANKQLKTVKNLRAELRADLEEPTAELTKD